MSELEPGATYESPWFETGSEPMALLARVFADDYTALRQVCRWAAEAGLDGVRLVICVKDENDNYVNLTRAELLAALGEQIVEER